MKKKVYVLIFSIFASTAFVGLQSCHQSAYPRDPYRGASANPNSYPQKRAKAKSSRIYRTVPPKPSY